MTPTTILTPEYAIQHGTIFRNDGMGLESLSLCFDSDNGTLLKHGETKLIFAYADKMRKGYLEMGCPEFADQIVTLTFPSASEFGVKFVNKAITHTGWVGRAWNILQEGTAEGLVGEKLFDYFRERIKLD